MGRHLNSPSPLWCSDEPLREATLREVTLKTLLLLALASTKRRGQWQLSREVQHSRGWSSKALLFVPDFVVKTQDLSVYDPKFENLLPHH